MSRALAHKPIGRWVSPFSEDRVGPGERRWPAEGRPAIITPEPPPAWSDYPALLRMAELMLSTRQEKFPGRVERGQLSPEEADRELRAFTDLVADWRFICSGEGEPADHASQHDRREALDQAIIRIAAFAAEHGGFSDQLCEQANLVIALRWHCEPGRWTLPMARITHELRAAAHQQKEAQTNAET